MDLHGRIWRRNTNSGGTFFCFSVRALGKRSEEIGRREESLVTCFLIDELMGRALSACDKAARSEFWSLHTVLAIEIMILRQKPRVAYHDGEAWTTRRAQRQGLLANALRTP